MDFWLLFYYPDFLAAAQSGGQCTNHWVTIHVPPMRTVKVISHYCSFTEVLPRLIHCGYWLLSSLPRLRFSSHLGEFAAITFGKDEVLPCANGPIVLSGTVVVIC